MAGRAVKQKRPAKPQKELPFWQRKSLEEMTPKEWESLCDGCGRCCLHKIEYVDTGDIQLTKVACKLLDIASCRCSNYKNRRQFVPDCIRLTPKRIQTLTWLPKTCGYRLIAEGKKLQWWHPLVSGDPMTVHQAGISVQGRAIAENDKIDPEDYLVDRNW